MLHCRVERLIVNSCDKTDNNNNKKRIPSFHTVIVTSLLMHLSDASEYIFFFFVFCDLRSGNSPALQRNKGAATAFHSSAFVEIWHGRWLWVGGGGFWEGEMAALRFAAVKNPGVKGLVHSNLHPLAAFCFYTLIWTLFLMSKHSEENMNTTLL